MGNDCSTQLSPRVEREIVFEPKAKRFNFERGVVFYNFEPSPRERVQNLGKTRERKDRHAETSSA